MTLTREEFSSALLAAHPGPDDLVYIERRGEDYAWSHTESGADMLTARSGDRAFPDVWMYYTGKWPCEDTERWSAFFEDLLAEMESMAGGVDRCRWSLDDPWPHLH